MKGKIAFVLGAAVGYVLGSRAGRERYEQIKRGAEQVWNTAPVQQGVDAVRDATRGTIENVKDSALRAGKNAFASIVGGQGRSSASQPSHSGASSQHASAAPAQPTSTPKPAPSSTSKPAQGAAAETSTSAEADGGNA